MSEGDSEVFFIESSEDDEGRYTGDRSIVPGSRPLRQASELGSPAQTPQPPSPEFLPHHSLNLSMEDILFERPTPQPPALQQTLDRHLDNTDRASNVAAECASDFCPVPLETLSGGSVNAVPQPVHETTPRDLAYLRGMTCSEVREILETFFLKKDANEKKFKFIESEMVAKEQKDRDSGVQVDLATARQRDRCARLVNVGNWGDGSDSPLDVLLPASLVPTSAFYTRSGASSGEGNSTGDAAPAAPRTLRKHQIEGIRFMWNVLQEGPVGQVPAVGCILAHTMGLGKTAQVVLFAHLFAAAHRHRPGDVTAVGNSPLPLLPRILIAVPKSTVSVWEREFAIWGAAFPAAHTLRPITLDEPTNNNNTGSPTSGGYRAPAKRLQLFRKWRRHGGVFIVGYEALVRLMQIVEDDNAVFGSSGGRGVGDSEGYVGGFQQQQQHSHMSTIGDRLQKQLKVVRRRDEGALAYGGADDPFTELVVCDEAHRLKSVHLQIVTALRGLHPLRRLLLTGTPLQNHLSEYWAMIDFAVHKYFDRHRFKDFFVHSIESSANKTASRQEVALAKKKTFTLINEVKHFVQRVDSTPLQSELPPLHEYVVVVPLSDLQKNIYIRFVKLISTLYDAKGGGFPFLPAVSFAGKIASHPQLLFAMRSQTRTGMAASTTHTAPQQRARQGQRAPANVAAKPAKQRTGRRKGKGRAQEVRRRGNRATTSSSSSQSGDRDDSSSSSSSNEVDTVDEDGATSASRTSFSQLYDNLTDYDSLCEAPPNYVPRLEDGVKLHVAMRIIQAAIRRDEKTLVFSLSTRLLDFFESLVAVANAARNRASDPVPIQYRRLDGSHSGAQRATMLSDFNRADSSLNLFLLSMKAGGVGITITAATRVILVDSSFNPADDQQAIGRAYRYGQTKPVFVYRLLCYQTLEFSIFEQKLAKEWLFKTVIDETAMKRDGLSGMHLREIFSLLDRAAKAMQRAPRVTQHQSNATTTLTQEDDVLREVQDMILYAQRYEVFLSHDDTSQYGDEEQKYYDKYRRERMFDAGKSVLPHEVLEQELKRRRTQRDQQSQLLRSEARTLTGLVDRIIRSRSTTDPHLAHLLSVMGLHVDPHTGTVQTSTRRNNNVDETRRTTTGGRIAADDSGLTVPSSSSSTSSSALLGDDGEGDGDGPEEDAIGGSRGHSSSLASHTVLLLDEDDDNGGEAGQPAPPHRKPDIVVDPRKYAPYRPGNSVNNAIDIDSD